MQHKEAKMKWTKEEQDKSRQRRGAEEAPTDGD